MQIPLSYAEDIIGIQGTNIDYIRRTSGAILTVQESRVPDEIIVEIKGTSSQVQTAQQLIQVRDSSLWNESHAFVVLLLLYDYDMHWVYICTLGQVHFLFCVDVYGGFL